jgi:hypothetical protein
MRPSVAVVSRRRETGAVHGVSLGGVGGSGAAVAVTERTFRCLPADLFAVLIEPKTYPRWLVGAKRIRWVSPSWPQVESYFEHTVGLGPLVILDRTTSRVFEDGRALELFVRARPVLEATVLFEIESCDEGCRLRMTETPSGLYKLLSPLAQPLVALRNKRSLQNLASLIEPTSFETAPRPTPAPV